jgi:hypothetical protein
VLARPCVSFSQLAICSHKTPALATQVAPGGLAAGPEVEKLLRMPVLKNRTVVEIARRVRAFLYLETGVVRNGEPGFGTDDHLRQELDEARTRIVRQERRIQRLHERLSGESLAENGRGSLAKQGPGASTPVFFVVGQGKSGTGWLKNMLDSHPEVLCKGEGRFFGRETRAEDLVDMQVGQAMRKKIAPSSLYNAMLNAEYLRLWIERSVWTRKGDPEEHLNELTRLAIDHFLKGELSKTKKKLVGDKTPLSSPEHVKEIATIYPRARVIHIIRNGRDQAISLMHHVWNKATDRGGVYKLEPAELAKRTAFYEDREAFLKSREGLLTEERLRSALAGWRANVSGATRYGPELLGENYTEVRYEDLLERPLEEARRLFGFLGAETGENVAQRCVESASFEALSGRERGT